MQCLTDIIGVTPNESECITGGLTTDQLARLKKSTSGLYLDNLPGGVHLKAVKYADALKGLYDITVGAINTATKTLADDLVIALNKQYRKNRANFVGTIGRASFAQTLPAGRRYRGMRLRPLDTSDAVITMSRLQLIVDRIATFPVYVLKVPYKSVMGTPLTQFPVTTPANAYVTTIMPGSGLRLPLKENSESVEYWIFYDTTEASGALPKDNTIECSTCGTGPKIADFVDAVGVQFDDLNNLQNASTFNTSQGFVLDVTIKCDNESLFCGQYKADDAIAVTMAWATLYKAGELTIEDVLKSTDISRYTTMNREYLWGKRNHFRAQYDERIDYLAASIDVTASDCFICREQANQPFVQTIFV